MHPRDILIADYSYSLPEEKIAKYPLPERDASKLLIYQEGKISEDRYNKLAAHIPEQSLLIFNNSKVIAARLLFQKPTGGIIELFCLEPDEQYPDITTAMLQKGRVRWQCLVGGASKWKQGQVLEQKTGTDKAITLQASYIEKRPGHFIIEFSWLPPAYSFAEVLQDAGAIPLPPYIKRKPEATDTDRYQTVYAQSDGSVAAPTAGLHFTENIFKTFAEKNIRKDFVTLHVGAGTFKPVKTQNIRDHEMHAEFMDVSKAMIENILKNFKFPIVAVGTTSLRTLESLYWLGLKTKLDPAVSPSALFLSQWEAYELEKRNISPEDAFISLLRWMDKNNLERLLSKTQILIAPGYRFKIVNALFTNFHQPGSTLLLLVAAFIGEDWRKVYEHALQHDFRFLSYGDGCLLWRKKD